MTEMTPEPRTSSAGGKADSSRAQSVAFDLQRPPWDQPLTPGESDRMIAAARATENEEVISWAITAHYVQNALAYRVMLLEKEVESNG